MPEIFDWLKEESGQDNVERQLTKWGEDAFGLPQTNEPMGTGGGEDGPPGPQGPPAQLIMMLVFQEEGWIPLNTTDNGPFAIVGRGTVKVDDASSVDVDYNLNGSGWDTLDADMSGDPIILDAASDEVKIRVDNAVNSLAFPVRFALKLEALD